MLVYYRIYTEDGAIPSKTPVAPGDPFLGRIKVESVPPPRTVKALKRSIAKKEDINDRSTSTSLFLALYSQSTVNDAVKITNIFNATGPGSTPQDPVALVAQMSDSERSALESEGRGGLGSIAESDTTAPEIRYRMSIQHFSTFLFVTSRLFGEVYYRLYADDYEIPSKAATDPEEPSLGRIRADSVAPPHCLFSIKRCISRVERNPALAGYVDVFANTSCDTPLKEGHISILTDGPGLSPNKPMAIVKVDPPVPDGRYAIKNREADIFWNGMHSPLSVVNWNAFRPEFVKIPEKQKVSEHSPIMKVFRGYFSNLFRSGSSGTSHMMLMVTSS